MSLRGVPSGRDADETRRLEAALDADRDLRSSKLVETLLSLRLLPSWLGWRLAKRLEGGDYQSRTLRKLLLRQGVFAGAFSYGGFLQPNGARGRLTIGRYASIAWNVRWGISHPLDTLSMSPVFYLPGYGFLPEALEEPHELVIEPDAWIAEYVVITSKCRRIGIGAVVGAGSVVTSDVPDFAVVVGAPARIIRYRYAPEIQAAVLRSRWWTLGPTQLLSYRNALSLAATDPEFLPALSAIEAVTARRSP